MPIFSVNSLAPPVVPVRTELYTLLAPRREGYHIGTPAHRAKLAFQRWSEERHRSVEDRPAQELLDGFKMFEQQHR